MKTATAAAALLFLSMASACASRAPVGDDFSALIYSDTYFPVARTDPFIESKYEMMEREMQHLIAKEGDNLRTNSFCVVGYTFDNGKTEAVIVWKDKNVLFRWSGGDPEAARARFEWASSMRFARKIGDENLYDRLPDPPNILAGDKFATRSGFEATIADCEQHGRQVRNAV